MIDLNLSTLFSSSILDIILILISASACFYCALMSRRLKALNRLDTGVGASIVSLTEAIGKTHDAAREAQSSTQETVKTLRFLLEKAESMAPVLEASMTEVSRSLSSVQALKKEINTDVNPQLTEATSKAKQMATELLTTVEALEKHRVQTAPALQETVKTLQSLLTKAGRVTPVLKASMTEVSQSLSSAEALKKEIDTEINPQITQATSKAKQMAAEFLATVEALEKHREPPAQPLETENGPSPQREPISQNAANLALVPTQLNGCNLQMINS